MKLATIKQVYQDLNAVNFGSVLTQPPIFIKRWEDKLAQYINIPSIMEFNTRSIKGIQHARDVVYHEMVHQYIEEYLQFDEIDAHGMMFRYIYDRHRTYDIDPNNGES